MARSQINQTELLFPAIVWLLSRLIIWIAMLGIAPLLAAPEGGVQVTVGWGVFDAWDSIHYRHIAATGYEYANDGKGHNLAFFPVFPLIVRTLMNFGLPFEVAGTLVNNLAFLAAVYYVYFWVKEFYWIGAARWSSIVIAFFPAALFTAVAYTEGLYLFLTAAALRAFDRQNYTWCALWGAIATATRPTGIALIPAFLIAAWMQKRSLKAYLAGLASSLGLLLFSLYSWGFFGHPLAFIHAQRGWRSSLGFDWQGWWKMLMQITIGSTNWQQGAIADPLHFLLFAIVVVLGCLLWSNKERMSQAKLDWSLAILILLWWVLAGDPLINTLTVLGSAYLLWQERNELTPITVIYGFCALGLIFASGGTWSLSRIAYGIVSLSVALGVLLSRHPRWGYFSFSFFIILLATFSIRFAQELWVG